MPRKKSTNNTITEPAPVKKDTNPIGRISTTARVMDVNITIEGESKRKGDEGRMVKQLKKIGSIKSGYVKGTNVLRYQAFDMEGNPMGKPSPNKNAAVALFSEKPETNQEEIDFS